MTLAMLKKHFKAFAFKNAYDSNTTYNVNEVVSYDNNLYIARKQTTEIPTVETDWHLFLVGGVGPEGPQGPPGPKGEDADVGDLEELETNDKSSVVAAINEVKRIGNNVKSDTVSALLSKDNSLPITTTSDWNVIIDSIGDIETGIDTSDATATTAQILSGATAYANGQKLTGTMVNRGATNHNLAVNSTFTITEGYHDGTGKVTQSVTTKSAATITPSTTNQTIPSDVYLTGIQTILGDADLIPDNIKNGVNIFGVVGTLKPGGRSALGTFVSGATTAINALDFKPSNVIITLQTKGSGYNLYYRCFVLGHSYRFVGATRYDVFGYFTQNLNGTSTGNNIDTDHITNNGFNIPQLITNMAGDTYSYIAYE